MKEVPTSQNQTEMKNEKPSKVEIGLSICRNTVAIFGVVGLIMAIFFGVDIKEILLGSSPKQEIRIEGDTYEGHNFSGNKQKINLTENNYYGNSKPKSEDIVPEAQAETKQPKGNNYTGDDQRHNEGTINNTVNNIKSITNNN